MRESPLIVVAGLGRCGSSLTMQMLHATGIPCVGSWPAFEVDALNHRAVCPTWLGRHPGHALKLLDPHLAPLPPIDAGVLIWCERDVREQAKSQAKLASMTTGLRIPRSAVRGLVTILRRDRTAALAMFGGWKRLYLGFEDTVADPARAAFHIARFLAPWWRDLDHDAMAAQAIPRPPACAGGLEIELALIAKAEAGRAALEREGG